MARTRPIVPLVGLGLGLVTFVIYWLTLSPTVNFVDSGELIAVGVTAGVAHAPGYPLYTLMLILVAALPFGGVAMRINAISAVTAALAVGLFYLALYEILTFHIEPETRGTSGNSHGADSRVDPAAIFAAAGTALLLGFSFLFWNWATQAKMYSLHFAFVAGLLWLAMRVRRSLAEPTMDDGRWTIGTMPRWPPRAWPLPARLLVALAVTLGFSFTNHYMTWLLLPASGLLLLWPSPGVGAPWQWLARYAPVLLVAGLAPLLLYLYLPLRASQHPVINWGTPDNWDDFWRHISVWELRPYIGYKGNPLNFLGVAWGYALDQFGPLLGLVVALLAVAGIVRLARTNIPLLVATGITAVASLLYVLLYQLNGTSVYYVPVYMMVLIWSAVGVHWALRRGDAIPRPNEYRVAFTRYLGGLAVLLLVLGAFWVNVGRAGHANDYVAEEYVRNGFDNFAQKAVVLTNDYDFVGPSYYLQYVLHARTDVAVIDKDLLRYPFYIDYIDRRYGPLLAQIQDEEKKYKEQERLWVNGTQTRELGTSYVQFLRAIITQAMDAGRPVYLHWTNGGAEEKAISEGFLTHPEGLALRVDRQPFNGPPPDPHFRLDGILTSKIFLDELDYGVATLYPGTYDRLARYAAAHNYPAEASHFQDLATQLRFALGLSP
ncbi:MAG: protein O-mannosyl-transferase family [Chloroflexia bacterium]